MRSLNFDCGKPYFFAAFSKRVRKRSAHGPCPCIRLKKLGSLSRPPRSEWIVAMRNKGTYTLSLGNLCRWLAGQAEELGVEIFPGFPAAEILFNDDGSVKGVATGDMRPADFRMAVAYARIFRNRQRSRTPGV